MAAYSKERVAAIVVSVLYRMLTIMRRKIIAFGSYYKDFLATLTEKEVQK